MVSAHRRRAARRPAATARRRRAQASNTSQGFLFRVWGLGFWGEVYRVWGLGFRVAAEGIVANFLKLFGLLESLVDSVGVGFRLLRLLGFRASATALLYNALLHGPGI